MYIILILFFASLLGIIFMVGRKLFLLQKGVIVIEEKVSFEAPHLDKIKHATVENIKKYSHASLVLSIRLYVRSINLLKNKYEEIRIKIKNKKGGSDGELQEKREASKFLKMMSEYKHKIKEIKKKIHEEEKN